MKTTLLIAGLALVLAACGGATTSCDFRNGSVNGPEPRCQEWQNSIVGPTGTYKTTCGLAQGVYRDSECPRDGIVAGCEQNANNADGSKVIDWYYAPKTADTVMTECKSPSTFHAKP